MKQYATHAEENHRFRIFVDHKHKIAEHNRQYENGMVSFQMGLNRYSDMSQDEFRSRLNGYKSDSKYEYY